MKTKYIDFTMHHTLPKILLIMEKSPVGDEGFKSIGTCPAISRKSSPIGKDI